MRINMQKNSHIYAHFLLTYKIMYDNIHLII